jgi:hypothetical protein
MQSLYKAHELVKPAIDRCGHVSMPLSCSLNYGHAPDQVGHGALQSIQLAQHINHITSTRRASLARNASWDHHAIPAEKDKSNQLLGISTYRPFSWGNFKKAFMKMTKNSFINLYTSGSCAPPQ